MNNLTHKRKIKTFDSIENLYCVVTKKVYKSTHRSPTHLLPILKDLTEKGYEAYMREINCGYYIIRKFKPDELTDKVFMQVYGEYVIKKKGNYVFDTEKKGNFKT